MAVALAAVVVVGVGGCGAGLSSADWRLRRVNDGSTDTATQRASSWTPRDYHATGDDLNFTRCLSSSSRATNVDLKAGDRYYRARHQHDSLLSM